MPRHQATGPTAACVAAPWSASVLPGRTGDAGTGSRWGGDPSPTLLRSQVGRHHGRRRVLAELVLPEASHVEVRLERWGQLLAEAGVDAPAGRRRLRVPVPRDVLAGPARVVVTVTDGAGRVREASVKSHVPAR
ncbi:hypothetical protein [Nocardioides bruguierae]|uniref:Uncharacterized protein n=1 Tax=Nocardioides bruguierae TaxID=2945102 RepID=A0A9X2IDR8_9ACTN|nr:hypothetical protein [Nocardioides bruguierae]MCM0620046.1 hypothetical protein [Nocardioides bruguierae]